MEAAMVSAFSGAMGSLLTKLAGLLEKDFKLASSAKKDILFLRDEMRSINTSLMVLSEMDEPIDLPHRELRDKVRELAYDMEDCVDIYTHSANKAGFLYDLKTLGARYETAKLIKDLKARVEQLGNRHNLFVQLPERPRAVRVDPRIQALYTDAANLQGIDGPRQELVELLQDGAPQLKVVSIVGSGGIGKTTLVNQVYKAIQGRYDCTAFVSVSRAPNLIKILSDLLDRIGWYSSSQDDTEELISTLRDYLQDKRYLIVIDDIWTIEAWNIIRCCFIENNRGSRVITTTRTEGTAKECCSTLHDYVYKIRPLNDVDSKRLFYRRIFQSEDACPEQLKSISSEILKKCGGLPLAILTIGSILATHQEACSMEIWEKMIHSFRFQLETSPALEWMRHVFDLGYNDLSLDLKTCMLYLGIFPEDCKILKDDLLRRWIAEGFITDRHSHCQEETAESYYFELINRNMIQIAEYDDCGEVISVRVHDLVLEYIILKSTEQNFITTISDKHITKGSSEVRRLSVHVRNSESYNVLENMALTQVRSFNLWGPAQWLPSLKKFRLLRVLHLDIFGSEDRQYHMSSVSSLFQLRYLRTRGILCRKLLQTQLQNLEQLQTLEVVSEREYYDLDARMLPSTLRHLKIKAGVELVGEIGRLRDLRTLCEFEILLRNGERMKELGALTNLRELKLYRCQSGRDDTTCDVLLSSFCRLCSLRSLIIRGPMSLNQYPDFLARWSPPPRHLRRLHVLACLFSTVPADFLAQLGNLSSLEIKVRSLPSDGADVLSRLTLLVHLTLHVQSAPREGVVVFRHAAFPNLKEFLFRCEALCLAFEAGAMPRLRVLEIECYARGTRLSDRVLEGIEHMGSLDKLKVNVFGREDFISRFACSAVVEEPRVEEHRRWEEESLEAALKEAISKHPGSLRVVIRDV
ncbi:unnamed protein product [Urochloa decumbens]|uniref:AAA+ ATPase domain-containing protein n=1 Tax=Urochloa decumbens TaxID=240449 RepID=A0ABC9FKF0_9POAL